MNKLPLVQIKLEDNNFTVERQSMVEVPAGGLTAKHNAKVREYNASFSEKLQQSV